MTPSKTMSARLLFACLFFMSPVMADTFLEESGIVMMEAESSGAQGDWKRESSISGYSGNGYLRWNGSDAFAVSSAGRGTTTYRFRIQKAGNYEMRWRSRITRGNNPTEHNDSWIRFPSGRNVSGQQALNGWTKVYMNTLNKWVWQSATVDNVGRRVRQYFSAGDHTLQISGRSNGHAIDRISLYRYADVTFSDSRFTALSQSDTVNGSTPAVTPDEPEQEPEAPVAVVVPDEPEAPVAVVVPDEPAEPVAPVEPETPVVVAPVAPVEPAAPVVPAEPVVVATIDAPEVSVSGSSLTWPAVEAIVVNVHRGDGAWLESLPADQTQWLAPASGEYYLVATGPGSWESWGRSETVSVESRTSADDVTSGLSLTAEAYSGTALELFWASQSADASSYEVRREGELLLVTDGRSYFDDTLQPGTAYRYSVTAVSTAGDALGQQSVTVSTQGDAGVSDDAAGLNLRAQTYSQSAVELFWNTAWLGNDVANYRFDVYYNGELLGTSEGRSLYLENLQAGSSYEFSLLAVNRNDGSTFGGTINVATLQADTP